MGTHPIFESDFDCLTERKKAMTESRDIARDAVFVPTGELPMDDPVEVKGYDFDQGNDYDKLFRYRLTTLSSKVQGVEIARF